MASFRRLFKELVRVKPAAVKGTYVKSVFISGTMTPGIEILDADGKLGLHRVDRTAGAFPGAGFAVVHARNGVGRIRHYGCQV